VLTFSKNNGAPGRAPETEGTRAGPRVNGSGRDLDSYIAVLASPEDEAA